MAKEKSGGQKQGQGERVSTVLDRFSTGVACKCCVKERERAALGKETAPGEHTGGSVARGRIRRAAR